MGQWSGRGIPPTRRKLHRWRAAEAKLQAAEVSDAKRDVSSFDYSWNKRTRGAIVNAARFEELWT